MCAMDKSLLNIKPNKKIKNSCQVLIISPGKGVYDYRVSGNIEIGQIVSVPLRRKVYQGIVLGRGTRGFPGSKLKAKIIGNIAKPAKIATKVSREPTVNDVLITLWSFGM